MDEAARERLRKAEARLDALETVLIDLLRENPHVLMGGEAFAKDSITKLIQPGNR